MKITRNNLSKVADRSINKPLVMPNLTSSNFIAEQLGKKSLYELSVEDQLSFAQKYKYVPYIEVLCPTLIQMASEQCKELQWEEKKVEDNMQIDRLCNLKTPYGELSKRTLFSKKTSITHYIEDIIKDEKDIKAMSWVVKESVKVILDRRNEIKRDLLNNVIPKVKQIKGKGLSVIHFWTPITEILFPFFDQENMIYAMNDYSILLRELMDETMLYTQFLIEIAIEAEVDAAQTPLWGYEQWSPIVYETYIFPYIVPISKQIRKGGCLFWVHTCGKMKGLLEQKMYHRIGGLDILECLNYPPSGDVDDWPRLRNMVPEETITKGNLEDSLLLKGPIKEIKNKTLEILKESEGFKHILGTSNNILDGTPLAHFEAMMEVVNNHSKL